MGRGLQRINRARCGKLPIIIPGGHIRPVTQMIAAKYATECNIVVRGHVPMLICWKDYKRRPAVLFGMPTCKYILRAFTPFVSLVSNLVVPIFFHY